MICPACTTENSDDAVQCAQCSVSMPTLAPPRRDAKKPAQRLAPDVQGMLLAGGRYEIVSVLGKGGMGIVYRAKDLELGEEVAIKVLQPALIGDVQDVERLKREIRTARRITHDNVIRIHEFHVSGDEGFVSMEILTGGTLHDKLGKGALPIAEALEISIGICDGLAAAHRQEVIHRDLKPQNVLFDAEGRPKLVDFGLARMANATSQTLGFSGTPLYMSPEMTDGREINTRSDIYSLGVMLFELFTGRLPFKADTLMRLAMLHAKDAPPKPSAIRAEIAPALEEILLRCLEKEPEARWATVRELADALRAYRQSGAAPTLDLRTRITPAPREAAPSQPGIAMPPRPGGGFASSRPGRFVLWARIAGGAAAAVALGLAAYFLAPASWRSSVPPAFTPLPAATTMVAAAPTATEAAPAPTPTAEPASTAARPSPTPKPSRTPTPTPTPTKAAVVPSATATAPPAATPTRIAAVATPAAGSAFLFLSGIPTVDFFVDGKQVGTKNVKDLPVPPGEHVIVWVTKEGGRRAEKTVRLKSGERRGIRADFRKDPVVFEESVPE